mmetsp:Transcript_17536/g.37913  ORF Transcript_17536/g.37913 Transcript_17536/m.37913 type:complete len:103 (+) Transcript_17536:1957-2265(+)
MQSDTVIPPQFGQENWAPDAAHFDSAEARRGASARRRTAESAKSCGRSGRHRHRLFRGRIVIAFYIVAFVWDWDWMIPLCVCLGVGAARHQGNSYEFGRKIG